MKSKTESWLSISVIATRGTGASYQLPFSGTLGNLQPLNRMTTDHDIISRSIKVGKPCNLSSDQDTLEREMGSY